MPSWGLSRAIVFQISLFFPRAVSKAAAVTVPVPVRIWISGYPAHLRGNTNRTMWLTHITEINSRYPGETVAEATLYSAPETGTELPAAN